jgi:hypothetical protein
MSQHHFKTLDPQGQRLTLLVGWDRPLGAFFLVVHNDTRDESVYCNLDDEDADGSLAYFEARIEELGITLPLGMLDALRQDQQENAGNKTVDWCEPSRQPEAFTDTGRAVISALEAVRKVLPEVVEVSYDVHGQWEYRDAQGNAPAFMSGSIDVGLLEDAADTVLILPRVFTLPAPRTLVA